MVVSFSGIIKLLIHERLFELDYFMPPSLYIKLLIAYFRGKVLVKVEYRHLDLIKEDKLLKKIRIKNTITTSENGFMVNGIYGAEYKLSTLGKKAFLKTTRGLGYAIFTFIGIVIGWILGIIF